MPKRRVWIQSSKKPDLSYEVVSFNPATKTATLKGRYRNFEITPFTKEKIEKDGYTLHSEDVE